MESSPRENFFRHPLMSPFVLFTPAFQPAEELAARQVGQLFREIDPDRTFFRRLKDILGECAREAGIPITEWGDGEETLVTERANRVLEELPGARPHMDRLLRERGRQAAVQVQGILQEVLPADGPIELMDLGCGQGIMAQELQSLMSDRLDTVCLVDLADYRFEDVRDNNRLRFFRNEELVQTRMQYQFDCILLYTVLHHAEMPSEVLNICQLALRQGGVVIVVESSVGILPDWLTRWYIPVNGHAVDTAGPEFSFAAMTLEQQIAYTTFIDWFFCKVMSENIYAPYQFHTPEGWNAFLGDFDGLTVEKHYATGFDQVSSLSFHTVHIVRHQSPI